MPTAIGVDRHPCGRERSDVTQDRALGHFQLGGELTRSHPAPMPEQQDEGDQSIGAHCVILAGKHDTTCRIWPGSWFRSVKDGGHGVDGARLRGAEERWNARQ